MMTGRGCRKGGNDWVSRGVSPAFALAGDRTLEVCDIFGNRALISFLKECNMRFECGIVCKNADSAPKYMRSTVMLDLMQIFHV